VSHTHTSLFSQPAHKIDYIFFSADRDFSREALFMKADEARVSFNTTPTPNFILTKLTLQIPVGDIISNFDAVFVDPTGSVNLLAGVPLAAVNLVSPDVSFLLSDLYV
jgi:hypothetical protein